MFVQGVQRVPNSEKGRDFSLVVTLVLPSEYSIDGGLADEEPVLMDAMLREWHHYLCSFDPTEFVIQSVIDEFE